MRDCTVAEAVIFVDDAPRTEHCLFGYVNSRESRLGVFQVLLLISLNIAIYKKKHFEITERVPRFEGPIQNVNATFYMTKRRRPVSVTRENDETSAYGVNYDTEQQVEGLVSCS